MLLMIELLIMSVLVMLHQLKHRRLEGSEDPVDEPLKEVPSLCRRVSGRSSRH
jgi:hypothetical protein